MKSAIIAGISAFALTTSAYAGNRDIIGGAEGAQTIHNCPRVSMSAGDYANSPASARIVNHKLAALGYFDTPGKGRKHKSAVSAIVKFQREMGIHERGIAGPRTALALAQATAPNRQTARCLQLAMTP